MNQNHVIQRLVIEIKAPDYTTARERQEEMSRWARAESLWRVLSEKLDALVPSDKVLTIPKLELNIIGATEAAFQKAFTESFVKAVEQVLSQSNGAALVNLQEDLSILALYFLEKGTLPPHVSNEKGAALQAFLQNQIHTTQRAFWEAFIQQTTEHPQMLQRLIQHLGIEKTRQFFINGLQANPMILTWIEDFMDGKPEATKLETAIWQRLLKEKETILFNEIPFKEWLNKEYKSEIRNPKSEIAPPSVSEPQKALLKENRDEPNRHLKDNNATVYYINNAGLVLLWQYFTPLFKALGWIDGKNWRSEKEQHQAVVLLEYLVRGESAKDSWEYDWTLNKILCGVPLHTVIEQSRPLIYPFGSIEALEAADSLLKAAIEYWTVLKNTSIAGLQETFLQRHGKLTYRAEGEGWQLQVERKTVDILLERLPMGWSFSVVKLPWMTEMIFVDW